MIITILTFFVILSFLVFIHELGHFWVAKKLGMGVEEFGFGLPPRIWGKKVGETIYSINALPIGGFVRLTGEDEIHTDATKLTATQKRRYFWARSKKERAAVLLAGVTMNFLLAVLIVSYIFTQGVYIPTEKVHIEEVTADSPAQAAGLLKDDVIVSFFDTEIKNTEELIAVAKEQGGIPTKLVINRGGQEQILVVTPRKEILEGQGPLGIVVSNLELKKYAWYQAPFYGTIEAIKMSYLMVTSLALILYKLVTFQPVGVDVAGPVGIARETGKAVQQGFMAVLQLTGLLSLNLAIMNILPIPALDGGRLMFVVFEKFLGRKVKPKVEAMAHQIGMAFLLGLIVLVTINDVLRIIRG